jgi:hypothetical protein
MRSWVLGCAHLCERSRLYNPVNLAPLRWASGWSIIFSLLLDCHSIFYNPDNPFLLLGSFHFCTNISTQMLTSSITLMLYSSRSCQCNNSKVYFGLFSLPSLLCLMLPLCISNFFMSGAAKRGRSVSMARNVPRSIGTWTTLLAAIYILHKWPSSNTLVGRLLLLVWSIKFSNQT